MFFFNHLNQDKIVKLVVFMNILSNQSTIPSLSFKTSFWASVSIEFWKLLPLQLNVVLNFEKSHKISIHIFNLLVRFMIDSFTLWINSLIFNYKERVSIESNYKRDLTYKNIPELPCLCYILNLNRLGILIIIILNLIW